jgi:hypothetical protein
VRLLPALYLLYLISSRFATFTAGGRYIIVEFIIAFRADPETQEGIESQAIDRCNRYVIFLDASHWHHDLDLRIGLAKRNRSMFFNLLPKILWNPRSVQHYISSVNR